MSPNSLRTECRKFAPNIFNKTKCSNCFKQKEEHSAQALECTRAMRKVAKSGYLFVAPGWDFSIPLNRTKRWQRRWFVLYNDGELNYSVDEHPDTVPQASIDMTQVLEVAGAEDVTGHAFSLAITAPDGVTFVKAMARDDARQWTSVLAVYTRNKGRHKRNATFPGGQTTTIHQATALPRSGTPNPIRPRYNSCHSDSVLRPATRWNQEPSTPSPTSPLPPSGALSTSSSSSSCNSSTCRTGYRDQPPSSASPPTRDKLNSEEKALVRSLRSLPPPSPTLTYDYETSSKRLETLKDIAAVLTRPRSISTPQPTPTRDSDTDTVDGVGVQEAAEVSERVQLPAETLLHLKKGWLMVQQKEWTKMWFVLCGNELRAYKDNKREEENVEAEMVIPLSQVKDVGETQVQRNYGFQVRLWNDTIYTLSAVTSGIRLNWLHSIRRACSLDDLPPRRPFLSSDEEYRTASESGRRESGEWVPASPPLARTPISRVKERARSRSRPSSRGSTLDSVSTDELIAVDNHITCLNQLKQKENMLNETLEKFEVLNRDFQSKQHQNSSLQEELNCVNERLRRGIEENDYLFKKLQELQDKSFKNSSFGSLSDLTNIDLDLDFANLSKDSLIDEYNNLKMRFEKAVQEIRAMKRELRNSHLKFDDLELSNITLQQDLQKLQDDNKSETEMMAARIQDLTSKLTNSEKQVRNLKSKLQDSREKRRSLSLKGKESFSINKEVEDKITELEAKILKIVKPTKKIKRDRSNERSSPVVDEKSQRRLRRKSLDSATTSEPMKVLIRLSSLESKVANCHKMEENLSNSCESLSISSQELEQNSKILALESTIEAAKQKLNDRLQPLEQTLTEISSILKSPTNISPAEVDVITSSVISVVRTFEKLLTDKLTELTNRRRALKEAGKLSNQASMAILAEKLAYETVIINRIHQAMNNSQFSSKILQREVLHTGQLLQQLQNKLAGIQVVKTGPTSTEEHLTRVLTRHLIHISHVGDNGRNSRQQAGKQGQELKEGLQFLRHKQHEVHQQLVRYKSSKLDSLALEMLSTGLDTSTLSQTAFSCVTSELVETEVTSALSRAAQTYTTSPGIPTLSVWASERAALELWSDQVSERLQTELQTVGQELVEACSKIKPTPWRKRLELERKTSCRNLLTNLADILAHKALIDARIAVLGGEITTRTLQNTNTSNDDESLLVQNLLEGEKYLSLLEDSNILEKNTLLDSEFQTIFLKCEENARKCVEMCGTEVDENIKSALCGIEREVLRLQGVQFVADGATPHSWEQVAKKCCELQHRLSLVPATCNQCEHLKDSIHRLSAEHSAEQAVLRERAQALEARLGTLDSEYALQLEQLRSAYRDALQPDNNNTSSGGLRARYQAEIEQLRTLCEKGLSAVESAHRRVVAELQDKHRRERQQLLEEKEQALAEETQATLAALDAMRKAHEHEVRREVGKFKQDFLRKLQATHDLGALHHQHEAEMRDIREEILALSERYSVKCVESASLEEKLCDVHQQLASAHRHIKQLQLRNNQLTTLQMKISALGWLGLVLALCVSTFGASCVIAIVLGFIAFIIGLLTLLYVQSGNFEDVYFSCNLLNNPLAVQEIPPGGLPKIVESIKKPKPTQKTDQRVTGSDLIDSSLQEIFGYITRDYVLPWYNLISTDTEFLELGVRKSAQNLAIHISNRVKEIDWLPYLTTRLVDDAASQIRLFRLARQQSPKPCTPRHRRNKSDTDLSSSDDVDQRFFSLESDETCGPGRCAVCTDTAREAEFLSALAELLLYVLLPDEDFKCRPFRALLSQLAARCLLRPLADLTTDPDVVNGTILWLCNRDGTLNSETFLTVLRLTEDLAELRHTRDVVARELQQLRGRDSDAADSAIKQQLSSLQYVQSLIDSRLVVLGGQTHLQVQTTNFTPSVHLSLDTLLKNNVALSYFIDYATSQGQQSELFFYLAAEGWRISAEQQLASIALGETIDITPLKDSAKRLCSQYLNELTAPVHILKSTRDLVYSNSEPSEKWFDELEKHVLEQLRTLVPGFQRSVGYSKLLADLDLVAQPSNPTRHSKHVRSLSDITCNTSTDLQTFSQNTEKESSTSEYNQEEDYSKLKVGNFTLSIDIIEAGVMSEKGKTFGIYATQVSKLYDSGFLEQWHIYRRYSDFHELHTRIRERWTDLARLSFPGKKPFQTAERALLERRMRALNLYLSALCRPQMLNTHPGLKSVLASFTDHDTAQIQTTIPPQSSQEDNNIPLRVLLTLADEVFDLRSRNQWLRRRLVTLLRQIIRAWFGDIVSRRIVDYVATSTSPKAVARCLKSLQRTVWPGGVRAPTKPRRSAPVRARTRLAARVALLAAPALGEEVPRLLGQDTTRKGLLAVCELVQRPVLTRRLLYVILEGVLSHLMPEKPIGKIFVKLYQAAATNPT